MLTDIPAVRKIIRFALEEDIGTGDVTTAAIVAPSEMAAAEVIARESGVLAGIPVAMAVLEEVGPGILCSDAKEDGSAVEPGDVVLRARGPASRLLTAERVLLNFVMRLSGIATHTRKFVDALAATKTIILDTRKTTPGLRVLEKYAVRMGGGHNHRMALADGVLIKNNHIAIGGDLKDTIRKARDGSPSLCRIEVEVRSTDEVKRAVEAGADVLLLDHMDREEVASVVDYCNWKLKTEASGNMGVESALAMAEAGVDYVSAGALTHSAPWLDFSMYLRPLDSE
ncbi:MAG: carboxylating nicotinate-nucleotide diphosphorylase [Deltaproteobacteria bacterium]|nr:carboxylating nicotinate-nucleotide diphosphorylase [Deltaproteobacteria bacterium]